MQAEADKYNAKYGVPPQLVNCRMVGVVDEMLPQDMDAETAMNKLRQAAKAMHREGPPGGDEKTTWWSCPYCDATNPAGATRCWLEKGVAQAPLSYGSPKH